MRVVTVVSAFVIEASTAPEMLFRASVKPTATATPAAPPPAPPSEAEPA